MTNEHYHKRQRVLKGTKRKKRRTLWVLCLVFLFVGVSVRQLLVSTYLIHPVTGSSMTPTLKEDEWVLVSKKEPLQRYAIISFSMAEEPGQFVKRIIGLPGDALFITGTRMVIDLDGTGKFLNTYSVDLSVSWANTWRGRTTIPEGCYFVLGDHLGVSKDSRAFGWVKQATIEGTVLFKN
ncbi:signal peptidase I [Enterococcus sp. AZ194]|uniref:signal peptidase I n=1 Tax=Enterococcus sp. AZ194 TaxID=2774629 RepID=UPI003F227265